MAYDYTIITYGGGQILTEIFNGISAAVGTESYSTIIGIASLFAITMVMFQSVFKQSVQLSARWFITFFLLYNIILVPKVTVNIVDKVNQTEVNVVQNVPWGLAELASDTSYIFYEITKLAETVFTLPDDLKYNQSGSLMASSLVLAANKFTITDPQFSNNMDNFMQQCVFYDLLLHKYTISDLKNAPDLWGFITTNASPARAFKYNDSIVTCQQGAKQLTQDWNTELQRAGEIYGSRFFSSNNPQKASNQLMDYLPIAYGYLGNVSNSAQQIMQQNMVANAIDDNVINNAGKVDALAALQSYAFSRAQQTKREMYKTIGLQAGYWLPIMQIVFEGILFGAFLFLAPLFLLPSGEQLLKTYAFALVWVQSWGPLYAILNLIMTLSAKIGSTTDTLDQASSSHVLSMMTLPGLAQTNFDISYLAGYFSISIPVIAYYLVSRGAAGFVSLAGYMGGATQSAASQAIQEETTGNLSFGNTSFGNHSSFNTNANHFDTNSRVFSGGFSTQMPGGSTLTITPDGQAVLDNRGAISSLGTSVNLADSMRAAYSHQADQAWSNTVSDAHNYSQSMSAAIRGLYEMGNNQSSLQASGDSSSISQQGGFRESVSELHQLTDRFAHSHGISSQSAARILAGAYTNAHAGIKASRSIEGKIVGLFTGVDGSATAGVKGETDHSWQKSHQQLWEDAKQYVHNTNFDQAVDQSVRAIKDHSFRTSNEESQRLASSVGSSYDQAVQARQDMSSQLQKSESFRNMASYAQENSLSINANASQPFVDWMKNQSAPGSRGPMGMDSVEYIMANRPELAQEYAQRWSRSEAGNLMNQFAQQSGGASSSSIEADYKSNNAGVPDNSSISASEQRNNASILNRASENGLGKGSIVNTSASSQADSMLHSIRSKVAKETNQGAKQASSLKNESNDKLED